MTNDARCTPSSAACAAAALLALLTACAGPKARPPQSPEALRGAAQGRLSAARAAALAQPGDPLAWAQAGWLEDLIASDAAAARRDLSRALAAADASRAQPGSADARALALCGLAQLDADELLSLRAGQQWVQALEASPRGPYAELAANRLLDLEGESPAVDDLVLAAAARLRPGTDPRAAHLLRNAAARIEERRDGARPAAEAREPAAWAALGAVQHLRVAGPYSPFHLRGLWTPLALDGPALTAAPARGPSGETFSRELTFPDGGLKLEGEPDQGDLFYAASDLMLSQGGDYLLFAEGDPALEVRIDGAVRLSRSPLPRAQRRSSEVPVRLAAGHHDLLLRFSRAEGDGLRVALIRRDGAASDLTSSAPAILRGQRREAPCALGEACSSAPAFVDPGGLRERAAKQLANDPGDALAAYLWELAALGESNDELRQAASAALAATDGGALASELSARGTFDDPALPSRLSRARAIELYTSAARKDPRLLLAQLSVASLSMEAERWDEASAALDRAEAAWDAREPFAPASRPARLLLLRARLLEQRGNLTDALRLARLAAQREPGRCDALELIHRLLRRDGALAALGPATEALAACEDGTRARALLARDRGESARAEELLAARVAARPASPSRLTDLATSQLDARHGDAALRSLREALRLSPRAAELWRRLAGALELLGRPGPAREAREQALRLAPGDLGLRRALWHDRGERLLGWADRDARALLAAAGGTDGAAQAERLLDHGAVEIFADGGAVERLHTVARVFDKAGIEAFGEAQIPPEAQVLALRTLKADGRVLEPERIAKKEGGISLSGLEPGDALEIDYLQAVAPRGPELPGLSLSPFYFQDDLIPMRESAYEVRAPITIPLSLDAHGLPLPPLQQLAGQQRVAVVRRNVPADSPEPLLPSTSERSPWVQVGTGAGEVDFIRSLSDWLPMRIRPDGSVEAFVAAHAGRGPPRKQAQALFEAVAVAVSGRSSTLDFSLSGAQVLAQGRGNRLAALLSVFQAANLPARLVLLRPLSADPHPLRFPRADRYSAAVLRLTLPDGEVWLEPSFRAAAFDRLPAALRGQPGWVVPGVQEEPLPIVAPERFEDERGLLQGRTLALELGLTTTGSASGILRDRAEGFSAAALSDALDRIEPGQRRQAVEASLTATLPDLRVMGVDVDGAAREGALTLRSALRIGQLARPAGDELRLNAAVLPSHRRARLAATATRTHLLLLDEPDAQEVEQTLTLPPGAHLAEPLAPRQLRTRFGSFHLEVAEGADGKLRMTESVRIPAQRVSPADYPAFAEFVAAIDAAEAQELRLVFVKPARPGAL